MSRPTIATIVLSVSLSAAAAQAQLLNNGFENHAATETQFNLTNAQLTGMVSGVTGFGAASEMDLVTFPGFHGATPISGNWMLGLHAQAGVGAPADGVAMTLATPIVAGSIYHLTMLAFQSADNSPGELQMGISNDPTQFGTLFASITPNAQFGWNGVQSDFFALNGGGYLTFRIAGSNSYLLIDNIVLTPTPGAAALMGLGGLAAMRRRR